jgi:hypothetical protein
MSINRAANTEFDDLFHWYDNYEDLKDIVQ